MKFSSFKNPKFRKVLISSVMGLTLLVGAWIWLWTLTEGNHRVMETAEHNTEIPRLTLEDGRMFHLETFGSPRRPMVVVIHGGPGGDYRSLLSLSRLADEYFVVFYDQRGTGLSPRVDGSELTFESTLEDLHDIIQYLKFQYENSGPVRLIGHSWGGMLAAAYLGRHGLEVSHAVLAEPGFLNQKTAELFTQRMDFSFSVGGLLKVVRWVFEGAHIEAKDDQETGDYVMDKMTTLQSPDNPITRYFCNGVLPGDGDTRWRFSYMANSSIMDDGIDGDQLTVSFTDGLDQYKREVLILGSECNQVMGYGFQKNYHEPLFSKARTVRLENVGHEMFFENPEASIAPVRAYLAQP
jgi:proline iminopeptidase